jgi:phenylalanyl-tRNA synthetase alpha chain
VRVIVPGRCYRYEAQDATHEWMFYQVEGLAVGQGITMADLKGTLFAFAKHVFGSSVKVRFRCDYFPFVEPGAGVSVSCLRCDGAGCSTCGNGWIELLGAGMVHPNVLEAVGYDAERYTGFAFGMGIERVAILRYGIPDIRLFFDGDVRFLERFEGVA